MTTDRIPISVLLPCRNCADTLSECVDSILAQSHGEFELLAIDDHSTDGTRPLLLEYQRRDRRIRLTRNPGSGLVDALNFGLRQARGEFIARMDGDDIMHPRRLALQLGALASDPNLVLVASAARLFPEEEIGAGYREYMRWQNGCLSPRQIADEIYVESPFAHPSVAFHRRAILDLGGYRDGPFPEDYDLWLRLHLAGKSMAKLAQPLLEWREQTHRTSRVDPRYAREAFDQLRARYLAHDPRFTRRADHFVIWGAGRKTRKRAAHLLAQGFRPSAWIDIDPRKIGNRVAGVPVHAPDHLAVDTQADRPFVLGYVANHGARELIGAQLDSLGYRKGEDYLMVG